MVKKKTKPSTTAAEIENHFLKDLPPAQRKLADVADKKLKKDLDRHKAGPLFMMVLPGEMEGSYIFVCRKKYEQLARNVLKGIVAFLTHHLHEPGAIQADRAMGKWIPKSEIQLVRRKKMVWCTRSLRAVEAETTEVQVEEALEFLDDVIEDTTDVYDGQLSIDMEMADAKDIDDGQTVTGMLDEMQERERQLAMPLSRLKPAIPSWQRRTRLLPNSRLLTPPYKPAWKHYKVKQPINWRFLLNRYLTIKSRRIARSS